MRPILYFYCQHSVGMGHFVRSLALARTLAEFFEVHLLSGGKTPPGLRLPRNVVMHALPALGMEDNQLVSLEDGQSVEQVKRARLTLIQRLLARHPPDILITELFPFGRKKFAFELDPLVAAARQRRAIVVCSVRDLLVGARHDQQRHDDRAAAKLNADFDAVIVHADATFARLEETFRPTTPLQIPVHYSGFVVPNPGPARSSKRERRVIVSAGGGLVGGPLFRAAIEMHRTNFARTGMPMLLVGGPFLPEPEWRELTRQAADLDGLLLLRSAPDLCAIMRTATHSISQFGYNTAIDLMVAGVAAVVVPYAAGGETEQTVRADRLSAAGRVTIVRETELSAAALAEALEIAPTPGPDFAFALNGAHETVRIIDELHAAGARLLRRTEQR